MKKLGIMGGTFDPIHNGHLILAEHARVEFGLEEVLFIPTGNPPHKSKEEISFTNYRYEMVSLAIEANPCFHISSIEMEKEDTTYTIDTIESIQSLYKDREIYFILGADSFTNIHLWKDYKRLLNLCNIIIAKRLDTDNKLLDEKLNNFTKIYKDSIYILESPLIEISSTNIRDRVKEGLSIRYLMPEVVRTYIRKNNLYKQ